jgi:hypothetical protein
MDSKKEVEGKEPCCTVPSNRSSSMQFRLNKQKTSLQKGACCSVNAGDWLVRDPQGNLVRCDDLNFKSTYEVLNNSAQLEQFSEGKPCGC